MPKPLVPPPAPCKLDRIVHVCDPRIQEVEAGGLSVQGHPWLHSRLGDSLEYIRSWIEEKIEEQERGKRGEGRGRKREGREKEGEGRERGEGKSL